MKKKALRKFHVTTCPDCFGIDGAVEDIKNYNPTRDLLEWAKEGRVVTKYHQFNLEPIKWCTCPFEEEIPLVKETN